MPKYEGLRKPFEPNGQGLIDNIARKGTPDRVYNMELFHDGEVREAITKRFEIDKDLDPNDPDFERQRFIAFHRFLGFDYMQASPLGQAWSFKNETTADTAELSRGERTYRDEHAGPITTWEEFEKYPWPDPHAPGMTSDLEWWSENLPDDMCLVGRALGHFCEYVTWLMGYETLCFALYDRRDLVKAIADRLYEYYKVVNERVLAFERVRIIFPSDDMGFKGGTLISPDDTRAFCLPGHKMTAQMAHDAGRLCVLHTCGNMSEIIDDLTDDVGIDAKHSFEDTIEDVREAKQTYGRKIALIGGIDIDFLCRADETAIRKRVRETLDVCQPGGGYCLGTGNSVANYIPLDNYLAMIDEGRLYGG
jgi:uroporphyrinogen decarboxylase